MPGDICTPVAGRRKAATPNLRRPAPGRAVQELGPGRRVDSAFRSSAKGKTMRLLIATVVLCAAASPAWAQAFANAKTSLANYTAADSMPNKACESLSAFKGKDIVAIQARVVPATADTPQHCRVIGTISPEVAFEV